MASGGGRPVSEADDMTCSVCHELFQRPKLLPCGHLLCRHCLLSWLTSHHSALCPLCRCAIVEDDEAGSGGGAGRWEEVADGLPTDLAMADLVHAHRVLHEGANCCVCEDVAAKALCLTCGDMFCQACKKVHVKQTVSKHHKVEDLSSLTADQVAGSRRAMCAVHNDKPAELFCPAHDVSMCHVCATSRHRGCAEVKDVEETVEAARAVLTSLADTLSAGEATLDQALQQLDDHVAHTEKEAKAAVAELHDLRQRLVAAITAWSQRQEQQLTTAFSDVKEAATEAKASLLQRRGRLTSHKHAMQRMQENKNGDTVTSMAPVMKTRVGRLDCSATLPANAKVVSKVMVVFDSAAVTRIEKELSGLGQVKVISADLDLQKKVQLIFHSNCGRNIVLSNNNQTAERIGEEDEGEGIVVSCKPMLSNMLYQVCLDKRDAFNGYFMWTGVTTTAPDTLTLPSYADRWSAAVVINEDSVHVNGKRTDVKVGKKLVDLPEKSRVGVLLDDKRCLHLYIDGKDQGVAATDIPDPCFPFFDVIGPYRQITALPVERMK